MARQLCFGAEEDQFEGFFPVPKELLALVAKYPVSGKQLLMKMGAVDADASVQAGVKLKPKQNHGRDNVVHIDHFLLLLS